MTAVGHLQLRCRAKHVAEGDAGDCSYNEILFSGSLLPFPFAINVLDMRRAASAAIVWQPTIRKIFDDSMIILGERFCKEGSPRKEGAVILNGLRR